MSGQGSNQARPPRDELHVPPPGEVVHVPRPPEQPPKSWPVRIAYMSASTMIATAASLGMGFLSSNIQNHAGELGITQAQALWLMAAYLIPRASLPIMLVKIRTQFGLRRFAEISIVIFAAMAVASFFAENLHSAVLTQFLLGCATAPMTTLAVLYMLETFTGIMKLHVGLPLAISMLFLGTPLSRVLSPWLQLNAGWDHVVMFEIGLALLCLVLVYLLPLATAPRLKVIQAMDLFSFTLMAAGFGCVIVFFDFVATYWWTEVAWLGWVLIAGIVLVTTAFIIELQRKSPMLDIRWLLSGDVLRLAGALLIMRVILSDQTTGAPALFISLGYDPSQMVGLFAVITVATLAGGGLCAMVLKLPRVPLIHVVALSMAVIGALLCANMNSQVAPRQMMLGQALIAIASSLYLPSAMAAGLAHALQKGLVYLLTFITVFLSSQMLGSMIGSGLFKSFVAARTVYHTRMIAGQILVGDPQVTADIATRVKQYMPILTDTTLQKAEALAALSSKVTTEATVQAYNDAYHAIAALAGGALVLLLCHMLFNYLTKLRDAMTAVPGQTS